MVLGLLNIKTVIICIKCSIFTPGIIAKKCLLTKCGEGNNKNNIDIIFNGIIIVVIFIIIKNNVV